MVGNDRELEKYRECLKTKAYLEMEILKQGWSYNQMAEMIRKINRCKIYIEWFEGINMSMSYDKDQLTLF